MKLYKIFITIGILLLCFSIGLYFYNYWDNNRAELSIQNIVKNMETTDKKTKIEYEIISDNLSQETADVPLYILNPQIEMPTKEVDGIKYIGTIEIPSLTLSLPVADSWSYDLLKTSPCRYTGSAYLNNLVVAAHNYDSHFGRLKNLNSGDEIIFTDCDDNSFHYEVCGIEILQSEDVEGMTESDFDLTLFTCTVGGQSRVTVRCMLLEQYSK